jgi:hypothetical protein
MTIFHDAVEKLGRRSQFNKALEELAELTLALIHYKEGKTTHDEVVDEIVDVSIMLEQLKVMMEISNDELTKKWEEKLNKLQNIINRQ